MELNCTAEREHDLEVLRQYIDRVLLKVIEVSPHILSEIGRPVTPTPF